VKDDQVQLKVSEIFYSIQGEGFRAGHPSIFIRLQGCSAKFACYASGIQCDTEFESGAPMDLEVLLDKIRAISKCMWIIWTGGEPLDQLTPEVLRFFSNHGYYHAVETSGVIDPSDELRELVDWLVLSPKVAEHVILKKWEPNRVKGTHCDELRYVRHSGQEIPSTDIKATFYCLSPHFDGINPNDKNIQHCIKLCLENPVWKLSVQAHKLINVL
jgi:organic radical activating enzyme